MPAEGFVTQVIEGRDKTHPNMAPNGQLRLPLRFMKLLSCETVFVAIINGRA
jgi:hypothetical protein